MYFGGDRPSVETLVRYLKEDAKKLGADRVESDSNLEWSALHSDFDWLADTLNGCTVIDGKVVGVSAYAGVDRNGVRSEYLAHAFSDQLLSWSLSEVIILGGDIEEPLAIIKRLGSPIWARRSFAFRFDWSEDVA